eukprot:Clim_evm4s162 gene=Clim_evmTU4s162
MEYATISQPFGEFHQDSVNVALHMITTPCGMMAAASALSSFEMDTKYHRYMPSWLFAAYLVALFYEGIPIYVFLGTIAVIAAMERLRYSADLHLVGSIIVMILCFVGQEAAHLVTGEGTYQNSYQEKPEFVSMLIEHTYYLLPLCVEVLYKNVLGWSVGPVLSEEERNTVLYIVLPLAFWAVGALYIDSSRRFIPAMYAESRVLNGKFTKASDKRELAILRDWTAAQNPSQETSTHFWHVKLEGRERAAFDRIAGSEMIANMFATRFARDEFHLEIVEGMNEIYVSGRNNPGTSDATFWLHHIDGPFTWVPFASVYRCILAISPNKRYQTHLDMDPRSFQVEDGEIIGFDFNREIHHITLDESKPFEHRIVLKLHYAVYPRWATFFGKWAKLGTTGYNALFRALYLKTIMPKTWFEKTLAELGVILGTKFWCAVEHIFGWNNIPYFLLATTLGYLYNPLIFVYMTSFLHYFRYITTYYTRKNVSYGIFKRDVFAFKCITLAQIAYFYAAPYLAGPLTLNDLDYMSLTLVAAGYFISMAATAALGIDGTYFGIELGQVDPKVGYLSVKTFPFNIVPHPMIVGQIIALGGMYMVPHMRTDPGAFYIPLHIILYTIHLTQEVFDIHRGEPWYKKRTSNLKEA